MINANGTGLEILLARPGYDGFPVWSPDGASLAFLSTGRYDGACGISNLYALEFGAGAVRNLSRAFDESVKEFHWQADGSRILFLAAQGAVTQLFSADPTGWSAPTQQWPQCTQPSQYQPRWTVVRISSTNGLQPPEVHVSSTTEWSPRRLTDALHASVAGWSKIELCRAMGKLRRDGNRGHRLQARQLPRWHEVSDAGGSTWRTACCQHARLPHWHIRLFTERGWAVFLPNFRGSGGYGERFRAPTVFGFGLGDYQDLMTGVDHLIEAGLADPDRLAISGASYGGYMTAWTISQTNRFTAAVVGCAITDVPSFMRTTDVPDRFADYLGEDDRLTPDTRPPRTATTCEHHPSLARRCRCSGSADAIQTYLH